MCAVTKSCQNRLATRQRGIQSLGFVSWLWKSSYIAHSRFRSAKYVKSSSGHRGDAVERLGWQSLLFIVPANKHTHTHVRGAQTTRTESIIEERLSNHGQHEAEAAGSRSGKKKRAHYVLDWFKPRNSRWLICAPKTTWPIRPRKLC